MTEHSGIARVQLGENANVHDVFITSEETGEQIKYAIPYGTKLAIVDGQHVTRGEVLTEGSKAPADILRIQGLDEVYSYIITETQKVYRGQSVSVNDKHIEIIARQMTRKVRIEEPGNTDLLSGSVVDVSEYEAENNKVQARIDAGEVDLTLATYSPVLLGITKAALATESFLSAASFQETTRVLTDAATNGKIDHLRGLKENVIIGKLIPAGTGMKCYHNVSARPVEQEAVVTE